MRYLKTFEQVVNEDFPIDYADLYALYLLSQEKEDWFNYNFDDYEHENEVFKMSFHKGEDKIIVEVPTDLNIEYGGEVSHPLREYDFQKWILENPQIFNADLNITQFQEDHRHEGMVFEWHPQIKKEYQWLFTTQRSGVI